MRRFVSLNTAERVGLQMQVAAGHNMANMPSDTAKRRAGRDPVPTPRTSAVMTP